MGKIGIPESGKFIKEDSVWRNETEKLIVSSQTKDCVKVDRGQGLEFMAKVYLLKNYIQI